MNFKAEVHKEEGKKNTLKPWLKKWQVDVDWLREKKIF